MKTFRVLNYALRFINPEIKTILEFGVADGNSLRILRDYFDESYYVGAFDTFTGLPETWKDFDGNLVGRGVKGRFTTHGIPPDIANVDFYKGLFSKTISEYKELYEDNQIGFLNVDCDLYSSTNDVLNGLTDQISKDTIIFFDEWYYKHSLKYSDHEQKAFHEWVIRNNIKYEEIDYPNIDKETVEQKIIKIL